jgi:hypothetical protein
MKVALVIGHAKDKQGAWGNAGISEFKYWGDFIEDVLDSLPSKHKYKVFKRPTSKRGYGSRMELLHNKLDSWGSDLTISFHFNAAGSTKANGHEVLYCSNTGKKYSDLLNRKFSKYLNSKDRGIKRRARNERGGGFLCRGKSVCILIEPYFAAHQKSFIKGTKGYENIKKSLIEFLKEI